MLRRGNGVASVSLLLGLAGLALARTWPVGPARVDTLPSQVAGRVGNGDTVLIDPGTYADVCSWRANDLLLKGNGGIARLDAVGLGLAEAKAIWVIKGRNATVSGVEFLNASCPDQNGAGIRQEGTNLTVRYCSFHDNEDGILAGADSLSDILIEFSEFRYNGFGDGQSHNIYVGNVRTFTLQYCWSHLARVGHQVKSRARRNNILYNRIMDEDTGYASREIDLPNAGLSVVVGNLIQKGTQAENSNMMGFGLEGITAGHDTLLFCANNTMVNSRQPTGPFVALQPGTRVLLVNNICFGAGEIVRNGHHSGANNWLPSSHSGADSLQHSILGADPGLVNRLSYDYHLSGSSPCIDSGVAPDSGLTPVYQYVHPCDREPRPEHGIMDIGAYEYGSNAVPDRAKPMRGPAVRPNPFVAFARVAGHDRGWFILRDVLGRYQGEYRGDCIGLDLPAGVYYLTAIQGGIPLRILKADAGK